MSPSESSQFPLFSGALPASGAPPAAPGSGRDEIALSSEIERRYLNYALSVITSRALPDVRDGLKPVQRRILYAMYHNLHLYPDGRFKKSASVVGDVLGKFHPHGDTAAYDALVRMAQDFSLRYPLIDGQGNFGSLDGDSAAAYRYTEAKLRPIALELLKELSSRTIVPYRENFDGTLFEPVVLPARIPNLLINGVTGIAVGMATNIPSHALHEIIGALLMLIDTPESSVAALLKQVKGPDFATGGEMIASAAELLSIYETGHGSLKIRGQYMVEEIKRGGVQLVITSIPYGVSKATIVERIAELIIERKLPLLTDVRDESTDIVRIVLEVKAGAEPERVMAYLYKHTPLQSNFGVNMTCLVPGPDGNLLPERLNLKQILRHFLDFRLEVVTRRLAETLETLRARMHALQGFKAIYDALDETIRIIRASEGKQDAAERLMKRFSLDDIQVDAILELKLYKLARLEIRLIEEELAQKQGEANAIERLLSDEPARWQVIRQELETLRTTYGDKRRTQLVKEVTELELREEDFILQEESCVVLTQDGWIKRLRELKDPQHTRLREGDEVMRVLTGTTTRPVTFFTQQGGAYVTLIHHVPPSSGYGEPIQKLFKFEEGERVIEAMVMESASASDTPAAPDKSDKNPLSEPHLLVISKGGQGFRLPALLHSEPSTRAGRRYAKLQESDEIIAVLSCQESDVVLMVSHEGRALCLKVSETPLLSGPGRGNRLMKLKEGDTIVGVACGPRAKLALALVTTPLSAGSPEKPLLLQASSCPINASNTPGQEIIKRSRIKSAERPKPQ